MVDGKKLVILVQQLKYVKLCEELMRYLPYQLVQDFFHQQ